MSVAYIIHCEQDLGFVEKTLIPPLPSNGFDRWVSSQHLGPSTPSLPIAEVMARCHTIVAVLSRAAVDSPTFRSEIGPRAR